MIVLNPMETAPKDRPIAAMLKGQFNTYMVIVEWSVSSWWPSCLLDFECYDQGGFERGTEFMGWQDLPEGWF